MSSRCIFGFCLWFVCATRGQVATDIHQTGRLSPHTPLERELGPGETDVFTVDANSGQFVHVLVEKKGVDVQLVLIDPAGTTIVTADSPNGAFGPNPASLIASRDGLYEIRVSKSPRTSETGKYQIELEALRSPTDTDRQRLQAETEFYAAVADERSQDREKRRHAIEGYERAARDWHALQELAEEALSLSRIGWVKSSLGELQNALPYYNRALSLSQASGDRAGEAGTLKSIGIVYSDLDEKQKALDYYRQALRLLGAVGDRAGLADTLKSIGIVYGDLGEKQKALDYYRQALPMWRALGDRTGEAATLNNIGVVYGDLGVKQKALEHYSQALQLLHELGNRAGEATALNNIGIVYSDLGEKQKALDDYNQALLLWRALGQRDGEASTLSNIGDVYRGLGERQKALDDYSQALLLLRAVGDRAGEADTLNNIGLVYTDLGEKQKALDYYNQALPLRRAAGDRAGEADTLCRLMRAWQQDSSALAILFGKEAVNVYQSLRRDIQGLDQDVQRTYLSTVSQSYRHLADLLISQGRLSEAEQVLSLLKEQEYFDYIRRDTEEAASVNGHANLTPEEAEGEKRYHDIEDKLVAIGVERGDLIAKQSLTADERQRLDVLEQDIAAGNVEFEEFLSGLVRQFAAKPAIALRVDQLREAQAIMEDLRELPKGTVAIYTLVGEDRFRAILRTPDVQKAYEYPIKSADLNRQVAHFREVVREPKLDPRPAAQELYRVIVGPMANDLRAAKAQTLMFSLDGALRYLPLAALYDGKRYLIEQYRVSVMTLASQARIKDPPDATWRAAGFGVTKAHQDEPALPSVRSELAGIIATKPGGSGVLAGEIKLDGDFTRDAMRQTLLKRYSVVHIASHFRFEPGNEAQSFLLLGDGAHLSLGELRTSANLFGGVQLLTLSACNTGVGDGTEVEGFGTLAQRQGAKAVIASLWPVMDESTSRLMQEFYRIRESSRGMTKLEALRRAQLELLRGGLRGSAPAVDRGVAAHSASAAAAFHADPKAPYAHPYYWAPFFLMGNWL